MPKYVSIKGVGWVPANKAAKRELAIQGKSVIETKEVGSEVVAQPSVEEPTARKRSKKERKMLKKVKKNRFGTKSRKVKRKVY